MSNEGGGNPARERRPWFVESTGSAFAVLAAAAIFVNYIGAHLSFFGEAPVISSEAVRTYWVLVAVLATALGASLTAAARRGAGGAWLWHALVVTVGVGAAVAFSVTTAGPVTDEPPARSPGPSGPGAPGCHSGGDSSGCPGG